MPFYHAGRLQAQFSPRHCREVKHLCPAYFIPPVPVYPGVIANSATKFYYYKCKI
jgi:hypothetical protein